VVRKRESVGLRRSSSVLSLKYVYKIEQLDRGFSLVERWFAGLTEKQLRRAVHRSTRELEDAIRRYLDLSNRHPKPLVWTKTADSFHRENRSSNR
jgi:benzoyl-CoA reductase/2-hydroxyglutaryl-CoA dehydratase subunit BcrC/BadD/HgdB